MSCLQCVDALEIFVMLDIGACEDGSNFELLGRQY